MDIRMLPRSLRIAMMVMTNCWGHGYAHSKNGNIASKILSIFPGIEPSFGTFILVSSNMWSHNWQYKQHSCVYIYIVHYIFDIRYAFLLIISLCKPTTPFFCGSCILKCIIKHSHPRHHGFSIPTGSCKIWHLKSGRLLKWWEVIPNHESTFLRCWKRICWNGETTQWDPWGEKK